MVDNLCEMVLLDADISRDLLRHIPKDLTNKEVKMTNYPDGSANDPKAPWNEKEPRYTKWEQADKDIYECKNCCYPKLTNEEYVCEYCFEPQVIEED